MRYEASAVGDRVVALKKASYMNATWLGAPTIAQFTEILSCSGRVSSIYVNR